MLGLVERRGEALVAKAREELAILEESGSGEVDGVATQVNKDEMEEMLRKIKAPAKKDAVPGEYELKEGELRGAYSSSATSNTDRDVEMESPSNRTARTVREELSGMLKELVNRGVSEIEAYDGHAELVSNYYRQALERSNSRSGSISSASGTAAVAGGGGILKNKDEDIRVDRAAIGRMGTTGGTRNVSDASRDPRLR